MDRHWQSYRLASPWLWFAGLAGISISWLWKEYQKNQITGVKHDGKAKIPDPLPETVEIEPLLNFDWSTSEPLKPRPFKPIYNITMGLKTDTISNLIVIDKTYHANIKLRREIVKTHDKTVYGLVPEGADSVRELYSFLMIEYLPVRFPSMFQLSADGNTLKNLVTDKAFPTRALDDLEESLRIIAETVEDDFYLLQETPQGHRAVAFVVCFASGFDPSEKLGQGLKDIHGPVPSYEKIGPSMERFFSRMEVGKLVKRGNWAIQTNDHMFAGDWKHPSDSTLKNDQGNVNIEETYYRTELQALSRLPKTRAILFSFKTYMTPMSEIKEEGSATQLADAIDGLKTGNAPGMWVYKGSTRWAERVLEYLRT